MSTLNLYKVVFHLESSANYTNVNGYPSAPGNTARTGNQQDMQVHIGCASADPATILGVLNANGFGAPGGAVVILDSVAPEGPAVVYV